MGERFVKLQCFQLPEEKILEEFQEFFCTPDFIQECSKNDQSNHTKPIIFDIHTQELTKNEFLPGLITCQEN